MADNKHVIITGSTRGIGFGMAEHFLRRGWSVTVSGRGQAAADAAAASLMSKVEAAKVLALECDVTDPAQVQRLWDTSIAQFGRVDIWVNNAGWSGDEGMVWERPAAEVASVLTTNLIGSAYGAQVAMRGMLKQGFGAIYNMEGMGSDGRKHAGLTMYGTTKYGLHYFSESLALEAKDTPVIVGSLRPGMVITEMITERYKGRPADWERAKKIFNIIAERPETVTPWLVEAMLTNRKNGAVLSFSSAWKMMWKFASNPFVKRNLFEEEAQ